MCAITRKPGARIGALLLFSSLSAEAALISRTAHYSSSLPVNGDYGPNIGSIEQALRFDSFNPALGTLNRVSMKVDTHQRLTTSIVDLSGEIGWYDFEANYNCGIRANNGTGMILDASAYDFKFGGFLDTPEELVFGPHSQSLTAQLDGDLAEPFVGTTPFEYSAYVAYDLFIIFAVPDAVTRIGAETGASPTPVSADAFYYFQSQIDTELVITLEYDYTPHTLVPEPPGWLLFTAGLLAMRGFGRRRH